MPGQLRGPRHSTKWSQTARWPRLTEQACRGRATQAIRGPQWARASTWNISSEFDEHAQRLSAGESFREIRRFSAVRANETRRRRAAERLRSRRLRRRVRLEI